MKIKAILTALFALGLSLALPACARNDNKKDALNSGVVQEQPHGQEEQESESPRLPELPEGGENIPEEGNGPGVSAPEEEKPAISVQPQPQAERAEYIMPTADGVNLRAGAGTDYKVVGTAEKNTMYALSRRVNGWYETVYKGEKAYISAAYCKSVLMDKSETAAIESVIEEGCKYLGVKYVYGAVRYHDGSGNKLSGFTTSAFDCSSLIQYIFKTGAGINLQVNTRTQIYQGKTVAKSNLKRGDLLFFTNASRKNLSGIERVGHVALYLGDNYILHTASDYAKIEQISTTRWGYYIQAQRVI